jgi:hypothetical protein
VRVDATNDESATIVFTNAELALLNNALNEVCNGVSDLDHDSEFASRIGATRVQARELLSDVRAVIDAQRD